MPDLRVVGEAHHLLDQLLAPVVGRVRLARDHQLHRPLRVEEQRLESRRVAQHQREALVRRHAAREADGQHVGVERLVDPAQLGTSSSTLLPRQPQPTARVQDETLAQGPLDRPDLPAGHVVDRGPEAVGVVTFGISALAGRELDDLARHPGRGVHAVGDRPDRHLGLVERRPQTVEHAPADLAVQQRDAVGPLREPEAHDRHVEDRCVALRVVLGAESEDPLDRDTGRGARLGEVLLDQAAREAVDPRRHRGVGGEHRRRAADLERGVEVELRPGFGDGELADPLEPEEAGVTLVGVEDLGLGVTGDPSVGTQGAHPADAEQQLLAQPVLAVAAIETVGDVDVGLRVALDVGVEHQQRHPPDARDPDPRDQVGAARHGDADRGPLPVGLAQQRDR
ncbi:unannotated protein [freshwater metagenome]|uniref:Unannotated protein n=1 Tax=freshwater metagenome TaxID=449393 RepID=A0A6J6SIA8_9ZZZZ